MNLASRILQNGNMNISKHDSSNSYFWSECVSHHHWAIARQPLEIVLILFIKKWRETIAFCTKWTTAFKGALPIKCRGCWLLGTTVTTFLCCKKRIKQSYIQQACTPHCNFIIQTSNNMYWRLLWIVSARSNSQQRCSVFTCAVRMLRPSKMWLL